MGSYQRSYNAMGSEFSIRVDLWPEPASSPSMPAARGMAPDEANSLLLRLETKTEHLEQSLSRFKGDSELIHLTNRRGQWTRVSHDLTEALKMAERAMVLTDYAFDPRILPHLERIGYTGAAFGVDSDTPNIDEDACGRNNPREQHPDQQDIKVFHKNDYGEIQLASPVDLGGIGKGYTADRLADIIEASVDPFDLAGYIIDAGGDLVVAGCQESGDRWSIGIEDPLNPSALSAVASPTGNYGRRLALCTSSLWRNAWTHEGEEVHHLIDPATGKPAQTSLYSVTAIADTAAMAEVITKYVLLRGFEDAPLWQHETPRCLWITRLGEIKMTAGMETFITWLAR